MIIRGVDFMKGDDEIRAGIYEELLCLSVSDNTTVTVITLKQTM
jgi:hypothetical protein